MNEVIRITSSDPNNSRHFGTGFVIYHDKSIAYVLTCAHVVNNVGGPQNVKADGLPATVVAAGNADRIDLALLQVKGLLDKQPLSLRVPSEKQSRFRAVGFQLFDQHFLLEPVRGILTEQVWLEPKRQRGRIRAWNLTIEGNYYLQPGYSGAPVIDEKSGEVLGVISHRRGKGQKGLALSIEMLKTIWSAMPPYLLNPPLLSEKPADTISPQKTQITSRPSTIGIYILNRRLSIQQFVCVTPNIYGWQLQAQIRSILELQDSVSAIGGLVGLKFDYNLLHQGQPLPKQLPLMQAGISDGTTLNLQVTMVNFGPDVDTSVEFLPAETSAPLSRRMVKRLLTQAFGHLMPYR